jgi:hypothetical protein
VTVNGSDGPNFRGSGIQEDVAAPGSDSCHYPASIYDPWTEVTAPGQLFYVNTANQIGDTVGWGADQINYYRQKEVTPCEATLYQRMSLYCNNSGPTAYQ